MFWGGGLMKTIPGNKQCLQLLHINERKLGNRINNLLLNPSSSPNPFPIYTPPPAFQALEFKPPKLKMPHETFLFIGNKPCTCLIFQYSIKTHL